MNRVLLPLALIGVLNLAYQAGSMSRSIVSNQCPSPINLVEVKNAR